MFFEVLSPTYHIPITIECALRGRLPLYSSVFVHIRSVTVRLMSGLRQFTRDALAPAEASDAGLVIRARRLFSKNEYPRVYNGLLNRSFPLTGFRSGTA